MSRTRSISRIAIVAMLSLFLVPALGVAAQGTTTILVRDFACDTAAPADPWTDCESIWGITYTVAADGTTVTGSPYTTVQDMGIGHGIGVEVPADATSVSLTPTGGIPAGYVAAPGYNPFSADVADLPEVGFGGESTGPGIDMIYVPAAAPDNGDSDSDDGAEDDEDTGGTTTLPDTGTGPIIDADREAAVGLLLVAAVVLAMAGHVALRDARPTPPR